MNVKILKQEILHKRAQNYVKEKHGITPVELRILCGIAYEAEHSIAQVSARRVLDMQIEESQHVYRSIKFLSEKGFIKRALVDGGILRQLNPKKKSKVYEITDKGRSVIFDYEVFIDTAL